MFDGGGEVYRMDSRHLRPFRKSGESGHKDNQNFINLQKK